ncbi:hypothetical protein FOH38_00260 [Lysinibacillus fusiformis]|nr:hypothetical protein FOH38_00260 [Lysinibacillus fusiformis]
MLKIRKTFGDKLSLNCAPIVRHHLTIGGAIFLWSNILPKINYKLLSVTYVEMEVPTDIAKSLGTDNKAILKWGNNSNIMG